MPGGSAPTLPAPPPRDRWTAERIILIVAVSILCVAGVVLAIWLASRSGDPEGAVLVLVLASVPVPLVVASFLWLDRYEPEPMRFLLAAFVWGGAIAPLVVQVPYYFLDKADVSYRVLATAWAPIVEETAKGLFLVVVLLIRRREFAGVIDGLVYAGLVGIGFAFTENILYYAGAYSGELNERLSGAEGTTATFVARGIFSPFSHSLFAAAFGVGVGVAVATQRRWLKVLAPVLGLAVGMGFHALWNGSVSYWREGFLLVYGLGFVPIFLGGIALAAWVRGHQGRVAIRGLDDAAARGWLHPDEIPWLTGFGLRRRARTFAATYGGPTAAEALGRYQKAALKMAFAHDRARQGKGPLDGPDRVRALLTEMAQMRPYILMPPPLQLGPPPPPYPPPPYWSVHTPPGGWPPGGSMRQTGPSPGSHAASPYGLQPGPPIDPYHPRKDSPPAESDPW
jgi:protease PrsW